MNPEIITPEELIIKIRSDSPKYLHFHEYYDGIQTEIDEVEYLVDAQPEDFIEIQNMIFENIPSSLRSLSYTSRFSSETTYDCIAYLPNTLKELTISNITGLNPNVIGNIDLDVESIWDDNYRNIPLNFRSLNIQSLLLKDEDQYDDYINFITLNNLTDKIKVEEYGDYDPNE